MVGSSEMGEVVWPGQEWHGPPCEARDDRRYAIAQVATPHGVAAFLADAPVEFVRAAVLAACDEWRKVN